MSTILRAWLRVHHAPAVVAGLVILGGAGRLSRGDALANPIGHEFAAVQSRVLILVAASALVTVALTDQLDADLAVASRPQHGWRAVWLMMVGSAFAVGAWAGRADGGRISQLLVITTFLVGLMAFSCAWFGASAALAAAFVVAVPYLLTPVGGDPHWWAILVGANRPTSIAIVLPIGTAGIVSYVVRGPRRLNRPVVI